VLLFALALVACTDGERRPPEPGPPARVRPDVRLVFMTDLSGYLEPCGCQSKPLGGIDRAAAQLVALDADGVPTALMTAGDLYFQLPGSGHAGEDPGEDAVAQQRMQAETLATILARLEVRAATPGPSDLRLGPEQLADLARRGGFPLLADGLKLPAPEDMPPAPVGSLALLELGDEKVGVLGLSDAVEGGVSVERARSLTAKLHDQGASIVVALLSSEARAARRLAGAVEGIDFVVSGGTHRAQVTPPAMLGKAAVVGAGEHGHGLLVIDVYHDGDGPFRDASEWSRAAEREALDARIDELAGRIREWERESAQAAGVQQQRQRLEAMQQQRKALEAPPSATGNRFVARWVELGEEAPSDATVAALMDEHDRRVNAHNAELFADRKPPPVPAGTPAYAGSEACGECHEEAFAWWKKHEHGRAYATLEKLHKEFNLECVGCHVTGYGRAGGSTVTHVEKLKNVGCESCHGPGSLHVDDQDVDDAQNVRREVAEAECKQCHNEEHSDQFDYAKYRAKLIVPGHGKPAEGG
jgi:hypothetical protein